MIGGGFGPVVITQADARQLPLPDNSVDLVITSPPYFSLRAYTDTCPDCAPDEDCGTCSGSGQVPYAGQIGAETTPAEYLDALIACTAEWIRVLKPSGSIFVNLGDKYMATSFAPQRRGKDASGVNRPTVTNVCERCGEGFTGGPGRRFCSSFCGGSDNSKRASRGGIPVKSLIGLPWRYAIRCVDELGLILRAEIVWAKLNGLPESATDRVRRQHEQVFHFVKQPRYYSAVDEVRESHAPDSLRPTKAGSTTMKGRNLNLPHNPGSYDGPNPLGKLPGSVWSIPTSPLTVPEWLGVDHFAAMAPEVARRVVLGWSPREVCTGCGEGRRPVTEGTPMVWRESPTAAGRNAPGTSRKSASGTMLAAATRTITGYACACPAPDAPTVPGVILDPCGGAGTTALVASCFGRVGISNDLSADYGRLARWRATDPGERARVLDVAKPERPVAGQLGLFEDIR
jgi:hypothetical protein